MRSELNQIQKTTEYSRFKFIGGNRKINLTHLQHLIDSIAKEDMLAYNPIVINGKDEIIDGQHRLLAAKNLKKPIYYQVLSGANLVNVQLFNANLRAWGMKDYLESYIALGKKEYKTLKEFSLTYELPLSVAMGVLVGGKFRSRDYLRKFKEGDFKVKNYKKAVRRGQAIKEYKDYTEGAIWKSRDFILALTKVWKYIRHKTFLKSVIKYGGKIRRYENAYDYLRRFEEIYNYHKRKRLRFPF